MNDDVEGEISYDATLVESVENIFMIGSFEVIAAGYTGTQVSSLYFALVIQLIFYSNERLDLKSLNTC